MRRTHLSLLAGAAFAFAVPAASVAPALAQDAPVGDLSCDQEVTAFLETVRSDQAYDAIQDAFAPYEERLTTAVGEAEQDCFAVLAAAQTFLVDSDAVIEGASDTVAIERTRVTLAGLVATADATQIEVEAVPAQVAIAEQPADVNVQQDPTQVDVATRAPEIQVNAAQTEVSVQAPQQLVEVTQPDAQIDVQASAPRITVDQPPPSVTVQQAQPQIAVRQTQPRVNVTQPEPEIIVRQFQPQIDIRQPQPTITVEQPQPQVSVVQPEPIVTVRPAEPQVEVSRAQPTVSVDQAPPEVNVTQRQPEIDVRMPEPEVTVEETPPQIDVTQGEPQVSVSQSEPQVAVTQEQPRVDVAQGEPQVTVEQAEPQIVSDLAEGADVTATTEEGGPDVSVTQETDPEIVVDESDDPNAELAVLAALSPISVLEVEFGFDEDVVSDEARDDVLAEVADLVETGDDVRVLLTGYASPIGDEGYNRELSERRVEAVAAALEELGVPGDIIRTRSLGERNEEVPASEDERSEENRRVEIRVVPAELTRG